MKADINEISGNTAEVVFNDPSWEVAITAEIELDSEGFYDSTIAAWIVVSKDWNQPIEGFLDDVESAVNAALSMKYAQDKVDYDDGRGDYLHECRRDAA